MGRLMAERYDTKSNVKLGGFRFKHPTCQATLKGCDTMKQSVCGGLYIYIYIYHRLKTPNVIKCKLPILINQIFIEIIFVLYYYRDNRSNNIENLLNIFKIQKKHLQVPLHKVRISFCFRSFSFLFFILNLWFATIFLSTFNFIMQPIRKPQNNVNIINEKGDFFQAVAAFILLYGCTTWTLTKHLLYGHLPPISQIIRVRRTKHAGHCWRSKEELKSDVFLWTPTLRRASVKQRFTYISNVQTLDTV